MSYLRPQQLQEALDWLADAQAGGARPVLAAGCTDLFPATEKKSLPGPVLDLTGIPSLRTIARTTDGWAIGAGATWTDLLRADLPPAFDGLKAAAREIGSVQIQNAGTLAGNLCNASPAADGVPCLLTLEAEVELRSAGATRRLPLDAFLRGPRQTALRPGEIMTAIHVPEAAAKGVSGFSKLGARRYLVISIAMVAARIGVEAGHITHAALAIGACGPVARRIPAVEARLTGARLDHWRGLCDDGAIAACLDPIDDIRADRTYRLRAAGQLLRDTVERCLSPGAGAP